MGRKCKNIEHRLDIISECPSIDSFERAVAEVIIETTKRIDGHNLTNFLTFQKLVKVSTVIDNHS